MPAPSSSERPTSQQPDLATFLSEMLTRLRAGGVLLAEDGTVLAWNQRAERLIGHSLAEVNTTGFTQVFESPQHMVQLVEGAKQGRPAGPRRLELKRPEANLQPLTIWCLPCSRLWDTAAHILVVWQELPRLESGQDQAHAAARLRLLGQLAAFMSHEMHNPLNAFTLHADILEEELHESGGENRDQLLGSLATMRTNLTRLHTLMQEYLTLARLSALACEPEDVGAFLEACHLELHESLAARGITLRLDVGTGLGRVALDKIIFQRALRSLIQHGAETLPQGGKITLRGRRMGSQIQLEISATGAGQPADLPPHLFEPFPPARSGGAGLGLYLVREVISAHRGHITASSAPETGTTFTITLPLLSRGAASEPGSPQ